MKKTFIKKNFKKLLLEKEENRTIADGEIKSVGIISVDEISNFIDLKKEVEKTLHVKDIKIYSFRPHSRKNDVSFQHFSEKDFNWKGEIKQPNFKIFIEQPFDLLIGYFNKKNLVTKIKTNSTQIQLQVLMI